jgi:hypothetical protein
VNSIRSDFLAAAATARPLLASPLVGARWPEPSALTGMTVGALAAHLAGAVVNVDRFLAAPPPVAGTASISAAEYVRPVDADLDATINAGVRARSDDEAVLGQAAVLGRFDRCLERLRTRLEEEPADRLVVAREEVLTLDDYLRTRLLELAVHIDDLCVSTGQPTPDTPGLGHAVDVLMDVARLRHGELAVLRALSRRERDAAQVLRVI